MLLLPGVDKWQLALPSHPGISFCRWRGSLQCIDVETQRPVLLAPFNPTFQFAFGDGGQYWGTADSHSNWIPSNLPESLEKLWVKTSLKVQMEKIRCSLQLHWFLLHAAGRVVQLIRAPPPPPPLYCRRDSQSICLSEHLSTGGSDGEAPLMARGGWRWWWSGGISCFGWMDFKWQLLAASRQNIPS